MVTIFTVERPFLMIGPIWYHGVGRLGKTMSSMIQTLSVLSPFLPCCFYHVSRHTCPTAGAERFHRLVS